MIDLAIGRISRFILALFATILLIVAPVSQVLAEEPVPVLTPTFTFAALPLPTPTYGTGELAIQRSSAPDATSYKFTATIMGNGVFVGTNNSRTYVLNTDPLHGGASAQYIICVPEVVMINVANSTGTVVASLEAGANKAGSKDLRSCPESPSVPADADNDGVLDDGTDKCLGTPAGTVVDKTTGCAVVIVPEPVDTDKDGINDDVDQCDNEAGPASNNGCAIRDADNDGVLDDGTDKCVDVAGPASNGGCPVVVSPKKAAVCKYVGTPGVDERLQTGQNPIVVDRKDWMVIGSPFQDAHGRSIVIAFLNPQDPEPSVDQCPAPEGPPSPKLVTAVNGTFTDLCGDVFNLSFQSAHIEGINYVVVRDGNSLTVHAEVTDAAKYKLANPGWQQVQTDTLTACPTESTHITLNPP
ncbi:MAG: hypothetical protein JWM07_242, partial [Candidatus Saccharibacteria bacterium]|nr:hypothetical protein [Candidatus Saccharibacteria bacterium]